MNIANKLLLMTALLFSTGSLINAATVTNGDFSSGSSGWELISDNEYGATVFVMDDISNGSHSFRVTASEYPFIIGQRTVNVLSKISQNIGEVNEGDTLSFDFNREVTGWGLSLDPSAPGKLTQAFDEVLGLVSIFNDTYTQNYYFSSLGDIYSGFDYSVPGLNLSDETEITLTLDSELANGSDATLQIMLIGDVEERYFNSFQSFDLIDTSRIDNIAINNTNPVPLPAGVYLFLSGLASLGIIKRRVLQK